MSSKPAKPLPFGPAPRPAPRISPEAAERLTELTADLGFGRGTSSEPAAEAPSTQEGKGGLAPAPEPEANPSRAASAKFRITGSPEPTPAPAAPTAQATAPAPTGASLKFDVPEDLWTNLKIEAAKRRVTVKFLVLEALAKTGYEVDLEAIPEDGRRLR